MDRDPRGWSHDHETRQDGWNTLPDEPTDYTGRGAPPHPMQRLYDALQVALGCVKELMGTRVPGGGDWRDDVPANYRQNAHPTPYGSAGCSYDEMQHALALCRDSGDEIDYQQALASVQGRHR